MSSRGRAGKFQKAKRGGGRNFSKNLRPVDSDGAERSMWAEPEPEDDSSDDDSSEEDSDEESSEDEAPKQQETQQGMTREERKAAQRAKKEAAIKKKQGPAQPGDLPPSESEEEGGEDGDMPANPNHSVAAKKMVAKATADPSAVPEAARRGQDRGGAERSREIEVGA